MNFVTKAAREISETFVSVALYFIGIVSAIPELISTAEATNSNSFAMSVALTGVGAVHVAILTGIRWLWIVFGVHILILEVTLYSLGAYSKMSYPIFTAIGAVVMVQFMKYNRESEKQIAQAEIERQENRDENKRDADLRREIELIKAQAAADAKRIKAGQKSVTPAVTQGVTSTVTSTVTSNSNPVELRHSRLVEMLRSYDTPSDINKTALARDLGVSRQTVIRDINSLTEQGKISLNGTVEVIQ